MNILVLGFGLTTLLADPVVRIQNFMELPLALEAVTQISSREPDLRALYLTKRSLMPKFGEANELTSEALFGIISYSGLVCQKFIDQESKLSAEERWVHSAVAFDGLATQFEDEEVRASLIANYTELFWQHSPDATEAQILNDLLAALSTAGPSTIPQILMSFCLLMAGSFDWVRVTP